MNFTETLQSLTGKPLSACTNQELYLALLELVRRKSADRVQPVTGRKLYYISAEFLIGKLLSNNLINLGLYDEARDALAAAGKSLADIEEVEPEPSLGNGSFGPFHQGCCGGFVFTFGSVLCHSILGFGCFFGGLCRITLGGDFIQLLGGHHSLVVQVFYALVRFFGYGKSCLSFLPHLIGCLYLFLTGAFQCFLVLGLCGSLGGTCLFQFRLYIRGFDNGKCISGLHALSLFYPEFQDTPRHFA